MRLLRQLGTNKAPIPWTARKADRKDMVEYDPEQAMTRIEALQRKRDRLKSNKGNNAINAKAVDDALKISALEIEIKQLEDEAVGIVEAEEKTPEELAEIATQEKIDNDPEIIKIKAMDTEDNLKQYIEELYGVKSRSKDIDKLKEIAIKLRTERIFEV